jgi:hypothetical protein
MTPKILYQFKQSAGESFRPSNGTEGMILCEHFCECCIHEKFTHTQNDNDKKCDILTATLVFDQRDKEYPKEWIYDSEGWPVCTKWQKWDWGFDDDSGEYNDPVEPEPVDPNQLQLFPLYPDERNFEEKELEPIYGASFGMGY